MNILKDVFAELFSMFVADARLTAAILATVALAAILIDATSLPPLAGGLVLLLGCIAVLVLSVSREVKRRAAAV
ncbi:hypothetical protein [Roseovarius sp. BRH_c41]|jgi:hypothetical protein|uniref:hypothetical protein n=1 Tax=Roseovarius sp. BRH_c41 TaxID=1629709 RepID=UPI0005F22566|nr:hypothetical protein [Roseovarius sp. BRH_c41]KJS43756.1 MAG: hypothetical protein VR71_08765 [Roseovarius sp. BRH_c41]